MLYQAMAAMGKKILRLCTISHTRRNCLRVSRMTTSPGPSDACEPLLLDGVVAQEGEVGKVEEEDEEGTWWPGSSR